MTALDALLADAAKTRAVPQALTRRVLADAEAVQPRSRQPEGPRGLRKAWAALGGWPAACGLAAATCAGFWIGVSPPLFLPDAGGLVLGTSEAFTYDALADVAGFGWAIEEG